MSVVNATGQIRPKTYVNVGANAMGRVTQFYVTEGEHVKKGEVVATIENVQQEANVAAQQATIAAAQTDISSYIAAENTAGSQRRACPGRSRAEEARLRSRQGPVRRPGDVETELRRQRKPPTIWTWPASTRRKPGLLRPRLKPLRPGAICKPQVADLKVNQDLSTAPSPLHRSTASSPTSRSARAKWSFRVFRTPRAPRS